MGLLSNRPERRLSLLSKPFVLGGEREMFDDLRKGFYALGEDYYWCLFSCNLSFAINLKLKQQHCLIIMNIINTILAVIEDRLMIRIPIIPKASPG